VLLIYTAILSVAVVVELIGIIVIVQWADALARSQADQVTALEN
jgi:hypothetical protein